MRKTFVYRDGKLVEKSKAKTLSTAPIVMKDIEPYPSIITGEIIGSRSHHRAHLKQHHAIEVGNEMSPRQKEKFERKGTLDNV